jgi:hypothetical protein
MVSITHLDGSDVVVLDANGRQVPAVNEVRLEHDRASVAVHQGARDWVDAIRAAGLEAPLACVIDSRDGRVHWRGPVHIAYA